MFFLVPVYFCSLVSSIFYVSFGKFRSGMLQWRYDIFEPIFLGVLLLSLEMWYYFVFSLSFLRVILCGIWSQCFAHFPEVLEKLQIAFSDFTELFLLLVQSCFLNKNNLAVWNFLVLFSFPTLVCIFWGYFFKSLLFVFAQFWFFSRWFLSSVRSCAGSWSWLIMGLLVAYSSLLLFWCLSGYLVT